MLNGSCPRCGFVFLDVSDKTLQASFRTGAVLGALTEFVTQILKEAQRREQSGKDATS